MGAAGALLVFAIVAVVMFAVLSRLRTAAKTGIASSPQRRAALEAWAERTAAAQPELRSALAELDALSGADVTPPHRPRVESEHAQPVSAQAKSRPQPKRAPRARTHNRPDDQPADLAQPATAMAPAPRLRRQAPLDALEPLHPLPPLAPLAARAARRS